MKPAPEYLRVVFNRLERLIEDRWEVPVHIRDVPNPFEATARQVVREELVAHIPAATEMVSPREYADDHSIAVSTVRQMIKDADSRRSRSASVNGACVAMRRSANPWGGRQRPVQIRQPIGLAGSWREPE